MERVIGHLNAAITAEIVMSTVVGVTQQDENPQSGRHRAKTSPSARASSHAAT
jgi:hypothetical protein